jgi:hypothetical protein
MKELSLDEQWCLFSICKDIERTERLKKNIKIFLSLP